MNEGNKRNILFRTHAHTITVRHRSIRSNGTRTKCVRFRWQNFLFYSLPSFNFHYFRCLFIFSLQFSGSFTIHFFISFHDLNSMSGECTVIFVCRCNARDKKKLIGGTCTFSVSHVAITHKKKKKALNWIWLNRVSCRNHIQFADEETIYFHICEFHFAEMWQINSEEEFDLFRFYWIYRFTLNASRIHIYTVCTAH